MAEDARTIPANDVPPTSAPSPAAGNGQEANSLEFEANLRRLAERDLAQKFGMRWWAVLTGCTVSVFMAGVLVVVLCEMTMSGADSIDPALAIAAIVAPIVSITTVTVALYIGAFRKFEERDIGAVANSTISAAAMARGE
ncbi:MAG: hypothetical protein OXF74_08880 [Rhodobacteraceae bacterium]|nr:hypothetical protein [Paracoccaceae bacterium]